MENEIIVSVICFAYNHSTYIEKAILGFLKQKCKYKYEIIIHDDASSDGTQEIIKRYENKHPDIIKAIYQTENQFSKGIRVSEIALKEAKGKYIAFCEGDDYWNDSNKLEIQIEFLENHGDYSACVHSGYLIYEDGTIKREMFRAFHCEKDVSTKEILQKWLFPTASIVYRKSCKPDYDFWRNTKLPLGDYFLIVYLSYKGKIHYFDYPMCVYRTFSKSSLSLQRSKDKELMKKEDQRFIDLLNAMDKLFNYEYHEVVVEHIQQREFSRYIFNNDWKKIREVQYEKYYRKLKYKVKLKVYLTYKYPTIMENLFDLFCEGKSKIRYKIDKFSTRKINIEK